jgi:hypothetical protein
MGTMAGRAGAGATAADAVPGLVGAGAGGAWNAKRSEGTRRASLEVTCLFYAWDR